MIVVVFGPRVFGLCLHCVGCFGLVVSLVRYPKDYHYRVACLTKLFSFFALLVKILSSSFHSTRLSNA